MKVIISLLNIKYREELINKLNIIIILGLVFSLTLGCKSSREIQMQNLKMTFSDGRKSFSEELLHGEISDTKIEHFAFEGPVSKSLKLSKDSTNMFLFIKGNGTIEADTLNYDIVPESMALPMTYDAITLNIPEGETIHFVLFTKKLSKQDLLDLKSFPAENKYDMFFTKFSDCEPYTEKIKSPNTISRTVLPADILPRVSLGTVEVKGPDAVGAHKHPMLDQLFLGLTDNDIVVHADDKSAELKAYSLLHIPIGSTHWATVGAGKKMYYLWMDFFLTKEGQEWLKTHKPISKKMN